MPDLSLIRSQVESFRCQHRILGTDKLPLDLLTFVDIDLRLDLIPFDGLRREFGADAAVLADFSGIYIDGETYDLIDSAHEWQLNRLRFSLAHEIGHLVLHREFFEGQKLDSDGSFLQWLNEHNGEKYRLEQEANEFAGRLLVPVEVLQSHFESMKPAFNKLYGHHGWVNDPNVREKACEMIAPKFGVHRDAISTRFERESIWPMVF